jgi:uncharacterized protein involved in exopolysaccharide biosynthesis
MKKAGRSAAACGVNLFPERIMSVSAWFTRLCPQMLAVFILTAPPAAVFFFSLQKSLVEAKYSILVSTEARTDMKSAQAILRSGGLAGQALAAVGGQRLFPEADMDGKLRLFSQQLQIEPGGSSRTFHIAFRHHEQELAVETAGALVRLFAAELEKLEQAALEQELTLSRKQLRQAENALAMFEKNSPPPPPAAQEELLAAQLEDLERLLAGAAEKERVLAEEFETLRHQFAAAAAAQGKEAQEDWPAFLEMKLYERELLRKYQPNDPLLASVRQQLEMQRARLRNNDGAAAEKLAGQIADAAAVLGGQRKEREDMQRQRNQLAAHAGQQSRPESRASDRLRDDVEKNKTLLARQTSRLEVRQQGGLITVIEQPVLPLKPVRPKKSLSILAAACFGLLCSLLHALLRVWQIRRRA